jgi:multicomponent Na+:H+ antiporter subunit B
MNEYLIIIFCLLILIILSIAIVIGKEKFLVAINMSAFSLISAGLYLLLMAPDVALTEASIGACVSTAIILTSILKIKDYKINYKHNYYFIMLCFLVFIMLVNVVHYLPSFGTGFNLHNQNNILDYYFTHTDRDIKINSFVAAILASFRGFDTFGETVVIYSASVCVFLILATNKYNKKNE